MPQLPKHISTNSFNSCLTESQSYIPRRKKINSQSGNHQEVGTDWCGALVQCRPPAWRGGAGAGLPSGGRPGGGDGPTTSMTGRQGD